MRNQIANPENPKGTPKPLISQFEVVPGGSYDGAIEGKVYAPVFGFMYYRGKSAVEIVSYNPTIAGKGTNKQIDVPIGQKTFISIDNFVSNEDLKFVSNLIDIIH